MTARQPPLVNFAAVQALLVMAAFMTTVRADIGACGQGSVEYVEACNRFAVDCYKQMCIAGRDNLAFSPVSLYATLTMARAGARGETA